MVPSEGATVVITMGMGMGKRARGQEGFYTTWELRLSESLGQLPWRRHMCYFLQLGCEGRACYKRRASEVGKFPNGFYLG